jgi:hypothetical protein
MSAPVLAPEIHGPEAVAKSFSGRARAAQVMLIDDAGLIFAPCCKPTVVFDFVVEKRPDHRDQPDRGRLT